MWFVLILKNQTDNTLCLSWRICRNGFDIVFNCSEIAHQRKFLLRLSYIKDVDISHLVLQVRSKPGYLKDQ